MRTRHLAASSALVLSVSLLTPMAIARADAATTLYVNSGSTACSDSGSGTQAAPYCTIQAAANVVNPGQTVQILGGTYHQELDLTRSGTADAPITFAGAPAANIDGLSTAAHGLTITGASYVNVSGIRIVNVLDDGVVVSDSSHVTLSQFAAGSGYTKGAGVLVSGTTDSVDIQRSNISGRVAGVEIDGAATGAIVTTDEISSSAGPAVEVNGATGTAVTSNTVPSSCGPVVDISGAAANTSVQNNVFMPGFAAGGAGNPCTDASAYEVAVDASATATSTVDYNLLGHYQWAHDYNWGGTAYTLPADLTAATGQGAHDIDVNFFTDPNTTAAIDSANSDAPGELATDSDGQPRVDDPLIPNTGGGAKPYYDRGVGELEDPSVTLGTPSVSATQAPVGGTITATMHATDAWNAALVYAFDFGDGTTVQSTANSATHAYSAPGTYKITYTVSYGRPMATGTVGSIVIVPPAPFVPALTVNASAPKTVTASAAASTDPWNIVSSTFDFGDGSAPLTVSGIGSGTAHTYYAAGKYAVKVTEVDASGASATTTPTASTLTASVTGKPVAGTGLTVATDGTSVTDSLPTTSAQFSYGDGTIPRPVPPTGSQYTYRNPGTYTLSVTATDQGGNVAVATSPVTPIGSDYTPYGPLRILDTRSALGAPEAKLAAGQVLRLKVAGANGVPAGATAVAVNLTLTDATGFGNVAAYPDGAKTPSTSNLNYASGQTVANMAVVPIGAGGYIDFVKQGPGSVDLIADVAGYYTQQNTNGYSTVQPIRILDTRSALGAPKAKLAAGAVLKLKVANAGTVPDYARAVALNLTLTDSTGFGNVVAYPDGGSTPTASNLNYATGQTVANMAIVPIGSDGYIDFVKQGPGSVNLIADVSGYFSTEDGASAYVPVTPFRYFDTRTIGSKLQAGYYLPAPFTTNSDGTLDTDLRAFVLNTTVTNTTANGFLSVFPDNGAGSNGGATPPNISNLNFAAGQTVPNLVFAQPSLSTGYIDFANGSLTGSLDVIADAFGFYTVH